MNNIRYNPFKPLRSVQIDKLMEDVSSISLSDLLGTDFVNRTPSVNVIENDQLFEIRIAAPGLEKEDFGIELDNERLIISSKAKEEAQKNLGKITRQEFSYSSFKRSFHVGDDIIKDKISASYEAGILTITLPKKEDIEIKSTIEID